MPEADLYHNSFCRKDVEIQIIDREEYEKKKTFTVVIGEPEIVHCEKAVITNLKTVDDDKLRQILEAGKPALGRFNLKFSIRHITQLQLRVYLHKQK